MIASINKPYLALTSKQIYKIKVMWQDRLKKHIRLSVKSQEEIAFETGISQGTISNLITGKRSASIETLEKLCRTLEIQMSELFQGYPALKNSNFDNIESSKEKLKLLVDSTTEEHQEEIQILLKLALKILL